MAATPEELLADIRQALADIEAVVNRNATAESRDDASSLRKRRVACRVDDYVRDHAWQSVAAAAAVAFLAGVRLARRR